VKEGEERSLVPNVEDLFWADLSSVWKVPTWSSTVPWRQGEEGAKIPRLYHCQTDYSDCCLNCCCGFGCGRCSLSPEPPSCSRPSATRSPSWPSFELCSSSLSAGRDRVSVSFPRHCCCYGDLSTGILFGWLETWEISDQNIEIESGENWLEMKRFPWPQLTWPSPVNVRPGRRSFGCEGDQRSDRRARRRSRNSCWTGSTFERKSRWRLFQVEESGRRRAVASGRSCCDGGAMSSLGSCSQPSTLRIQATEKNKLFLIIWIFVILKVIVEYFKKVIVKNKNVFHKESISIFIPFWTSVMFLFCCNSAFRSN
jgi:hypothetical protein